MKKDYLKNMFIFILAFVLLMPSFNAVVAEGKTSVAAIITEIVGTLYVMPFIDDKWRVAEKGMFLYEGDKLKTDAKSKAAITFVNGIEVKLNDSTEITIEVSEDMRGIGNEIDLLLGEIWSRVIKEGTQFEVQTPQAVAAVRGTEFDIDVGGNGVTMVMVYKGTVEVANDFGTVNVKENSKTIVQSNEAPQPPITIDESDKKDWHLTEFEEGKEEEEVLEENEKSLILKIKDGDKDQELRLKFEK